MSLEPGLIGYAALASLALSVKKHRPMPPLAFMPASDTARLTGWLLMAVALFLSVRQFGGAQGVVAWIGQTCLAAIVFVLLGSWRLRHAYIGAVAALILAMPMAVFSIG